MALRYQELKDEFGRLQKLLTERELELSKLRKKLEGDKVMDELLAKAGLKSVDTTSDAMAAKIVEQLRRVRELTAELNVERTKGRQLARKVQELEASSLCVLILLCSRFWCKIFD